MKSRMTAVGRAPPARPQAQPRGISHATAGCLLPGCANSGTSVPHAAGLEAPGTTAHTVPAANQGQEDSIHIHFLLLTMVQVQSPTNFSRTGRKCRNNRAVRKIECRRENKFVSYNASNTENLHLCFTETISI